MLRGTGFADDDIVERGNVNGQSVVGAADRHPGRPLSAAAQQLTTGPSWIDTLCLQNRGKIPVASLRSATAGYRER